ncbi:cytochrome c oxidase subunit 3 [Mycobacterium sp. MYCO198283]|nr:cytochrome c oxidase subunit 3 [Mycobacterium sp. MYCO198283]MCG5434167.1 cytochrome c oxidase subunit 3 [Mycobacterium sp. MYCO198283]
MTTEAVPDAGVRADPATAGLQGSGGMWFFVLGDILIFSAYFVIFLVHRSADRDGFLTGQHQLSATIGVVNTLVLLSSSWLVALGVQAARAGDHRRARRLTAGGGGCGLVFVVVKLAEWSAEVSRGHTLVGSEFFSFYYMLTGVHLSHVLLGLLIVGVVLRELTDERLRRIRVVESGAVYWHMVDMLWVLIFALIYLVR